MTATLTVWSDVGCPWARLAVHRLWQARERLGLAAEVLLDHRAFVLEIANSRPTPKRALDAETAVISGLAPDAGWSLWKGRDAEYPVSTLLALEAVQAAKEQGLAASERLDRALRTAFFADSKCVTMRHVVLDVAARTDGVDAAALERALDDGRARAAVVGQHREATAAGSPVKGSPHVLLPDGTGLHNPGVRMRWEAAAPVVESDDPSVYDDLLRRAVGR